MKKLIAITVAILIMVMFLTAFVACDKKGEEQEITADTKFEDIVSDKITEEELISMAQEAKAEFYNEKSEIEPRGNYRVKVTTMEVGHEGYSETRTILTEVNCNTIKTDTVTMSYYTNNEDKEPYTYTIYSYIYKEGNNYYQLSSKDNINWEKTKETLSSFVDSQTYLVALNLMIDVFTFEIEVEYEWNEQYNGYYVKGSDYEVILKFKNGRLCAMSPSDEERYFGAVFYDFGKVPEITLPEITE